jgi:hypothetical protein
MFDRTERLPGAALPIVLIHGSPEPNRVLGFNLTERQAMIGTDLIEAEATETVKAFHRRLVKVARERGGRIVSVGSKPSPADPSRRPDGITLN